MFVEIDMMEVDDDDGDFEKALNKLKNIKESQTERVTPESTSNTSSTSSTSRKPMPPVRLGLVAKLR
mgnify:CR=1 FL=1